MKWHYCLICWQMCTYTPASVFLSLFFSYVKIKRGGQSVKCRTRERETSGQSSFCLQCFSEISRICHFLLPSSLLITHTRYINLPSYCSSTQSVTFQTSSSLVHQRVPYMLVQINFFPLCLKKLKLLPPIFLQSKFA